MRGPRLAKEEESEEGASTEKGGGQKEGFRKVQKKKGQLLHLQRKKRRGSALGKTRRAVSIAGLPSFSFLPITIVVAVFYHSNQKQRQLLPCWRHRDRAAVTRTERTRASLFAPPGKRPSATSREKYTTALHLQLVVAAAVVFDELRLLTILAASTIVTVVVVVFVAPE